MKMHATLCIAAVFGVPCSASAQVLISDSLLISFTQEELVAQGVGNAQYDITVHRLIYNTIDPFGDPTVASGAVVLPVAPGCELPLAAYMHGTILQRNDVPSRLSSEALVGYYLGAGGYVAAMPDYLGLGDGPGFHPYMHAASEASASVDMLRAVREFCAGQGALLNDQLFLVGYSQGGHACMATHRAIETLFPDEFQVTASAPCSGPYDASGVQAEVITSSEPYPAPYYLPYVMLSYGRIYPGLYNEVSDVLEEPYATLLPPLFEGNNGSGAVDAVMPEVPSEILVDSVLQAFMDDPGHPFRLALRDNDLYDWVPAAPVRMIYCEADDHVAYENSIVTLNAMQANGAAQVQAVSAGAAFDHGSCAYPALLAAKFWFDGLQEECAGVGVEEGVEKGWSLWPVPSRGDVFYTVPERFVGIASWRIVQADGRLVQQGPSTYGIGPHHVDLQHLAAGVYRLHVGEGAKGHSFSFVLQP